MSDTNDQSGLRRGVFQVVLAYAVFAGLWILLSDRAIGVMFAEHEQIVQASMIKGWLFVAVTSLLLYALVRRLIGQVIRAQQAGEAELRASEARNRLLLESTAEAIYGVDPDGMCTFVNPACLRLLGYECADELLGRHVHELIHHSHVDGSPYPAQECRIYAAYRENAGAHVDDEVFWRRDGTSFPVEYWSHPIRREGEVVGAVVAWLDISERKRAEAALYESERRFVATFEQAAVGIAHVAPDGRWLQVNRKLCAIVGYTQEELLTKTFQDITHPDDLDADLGQLRRVLAREIDTYAIEKRYFRKDGGLICVNLTVALVRKVNGTPDYLISVVEDISARKAAEAELRLRNEELERFNHAAIERELRMIALKQEVNALACELGRSPPYALKFLKDDTLP